MINYLVMQYRALFPRKTPKGAPTKKQFQKMTLAERRNISYKIDGVDVKVIDKLKKEAKKLPPMQKMKNGRPVPLNHETELINNFLFCGFEGIYNYLRSVKEAQDLANAVAKIQDDAKEESILKK